MEIESLIKSKVRDVRDYPKEGIVFKDITPLLKDGKAFSACVDAFADLIKGRNIDAIAGIEARGFLVGSALSYRTGIGFVPIRKKGKLPADVISTSYSLEYGEAAMEMHKDAIRRGDDVLIVDDVLATGGSASAAVSLVNQLHGNVAALAFLIELGFLNGRKLLQGHEIISLARY